MSRWADRSSARSGSTFNDYEFEQELLAAEEQLRYASTHLEDADPAQSFPEPDDDAGEGGIFLDSFNILAGGTESLRRRKLAQADARLARPRATLVITWIAWIIALIVAVIAVTFSTLDFVGVLRNPFLAVSLVPESSLTLPVFSVCSSQLDIPALPLLNRSKEAQFRGMPLFTARSVENFEEDSMIFWPDTLGQKVMTPAYRGPPDGSCLRRFRALDARDSEDKTIALSNGLLDTRCQYCFQIGRESPITLRAATSERSREQINPVAFREGVRLHLVMFQYRNCLTLDDVRSTAGADHWNFVKAEIVRAAPELQSRGILDFSEAANLTNQDDLNRVIIISGATPEGRNIPFSLDHLGIIMTARDMACHVFFWSDFFFPQATAPVDVRYKYNTTTWKWDRTGTGPFLRERRAEADYLAFRSTNLEDQSNAIISRPVEVYMENRDELDDNGMLDSRSERNIVGADFLHRVGDRAERIATIDESQVSQVRLTRVQSEDNKVSYRAQVTQTDAELFSSRDYYLSYFVHFRFDSFFTQRLIKRQEAFWARYFVDAIGYISMAFGFTVYSLLVAPTNMFFCGFVWGGRHRKDRDATAAREGKTAAAAEESVMGDTEGARSWTRSGNKGLRLRVGVGRKHFTGAMEPLQGIALP